MYFCTIDNFPGNGAKMLGPLYAIWIKIKMQSAKHKLSTQGSILFQIYRARSMQAQFLSDTAIYIYLYAIETVCKLGHTFLKRNQT